LAKKLFSDKQMEQAAWIIWTILGVILIIAEIFTLGFVLFWFGLGALAAAVVGLLGFGFIWQFVTFAVVSTVLTVMSRAIFSNYFSHNDENAVKTGIDSLPGQVGTVINSSKGAMNEGSVKVFGSTWTAFPIDEETPLLEGDKVEVVRVQGASLYVRKFEEHKKLPNWRDEG